MEPLAFKLRPKDLKNFIGQKHLVGKNQPLKLMIDGKIAHSFILWGPPGVGKTTLARIYAKTLDLPMVELSAVSAGKEDIKKVLSIGFTKSVVLFLDEIHRFNKAQQDFLLPYVESGQLILIGATTENPSFEVIPALLSRAKLFILNPLSEVEMGKILDRSSFILNKEVKKEIVRLAEGDARRALSLIENVALFHKEITLENLEKSLDTKPYYYDRLGEKHYETISAFIKSMRASNVDAGLYYLARMLEGGEDPKFIARRMIVFASEDIGLAQPTALVVANEVFRAVEIVGLPEARINLAHGVVYLAKAKKDRRVYDSLQLALADVVKFGNLPIPKKILNAPNKIMKNLGYGANYKMTDQADLLPLKLKNKKYFK